MGQAKTLVAAWNWWPLPAAIILFAIVFLPVLYLVRAQRKLTSPDRLGSFWANLKGVDWQGNRSEAPDAVAEAIVQLFLYEIEYYYKLRMRRSAVAMVTRALAFVFGTAGLLAPLIVATLPEPPWPRASQFGYIMLAAAAASIAANQLFGATSGHIQFVMAQYKLEQLLHEFAVGWQAWREEAQRTPPDDEKAQAKLTAKAFAMFRDVAKRAYRIIDRDTAAWAAAVVSAESQFARRVGPPSRAEE